MVLEDDCKFINITENNCNQISKFILNESFDALYLHNNSNFTSPKI